MTDIPLNIMVQGEQLRLNLPKDWSVAEFPEGSYEGYVWYSEASRYILDFEFGDIR